MKKFNEFIEKYVYLKNKGGGSYSEPPPQGRRRTPRASPSNFLEFFCLYLAPGNLFRRKIDDFGNEKKKRDGSLSKVHNHAK